MELQIKVKLYSYSGNYYGIYYRYKWKHLNWFNPYKSLVEVYEGAYLINNHPVLFEKFENTVHFAEQLKANPNSIKEHYKEQDKIYKETKKRKNEYFKSRNLSKNI